MSLTISLFLTPFLMFLLAIIFLASIGESLGVRRLYIKLLLALFEVRHLLKTHKYELIVMLYRTILKIVN